VGYVYLWNGEEGREASNDSIDDAEDRVAISVGKKWDDEEDEDVRPPPAPLQQIQS